MMEDAILTDIKIQIHKAKIEDFRMTNMEWIVSQLFIDYLRDNHKYQLEYCFGGMPVNIIQKDGFYAKLVKLPPMDGSMLKSAFYNYAKKKNETEEALDNVVALLKEGDHIGINREEAIYRGTLREYIMADIDGKRGYFGRDELTGVSSSDRESSDC